MITLSTLRQIKSKGGQIQEQLERMMREKYPLVKHIEAVAVSDFEDIGYYNDDGSFVACVVQQEREQENKGFFRLELDEKAYDPPVLHPVIFINSRIVSQCPGAADYLISHELGHRDYVDRNIEDTIAAELMVKALVRNYSESYLACMTGYGSDDGVRYAVNALADCIIDSSYICQKKIQFNARDVKKFLKEFLVNEISKQGNDAEKVLFEMGFLYAFRFPLPSRSGVKEVDSAIANWMEFLDTNGKAHEFNRMIQDFLKQPRVASNCRRMAFKLAYFLSQLPPIHNHHACERNDSVKDVIDAVTGSNISTVSIPSREKVSREEKVEMIKSALESLMEFCEDECNDQELMKALVEQAQEEISDLGKVKNKGSIGGAGSGYGQGSIKVSEVLSYAFSDSHRRVVELLKRLYSERETTIHRKNLQLKLRATENVNFSRFDIRNIDLTKSIAYGGGRFNIALARQKKTVNVNTQGEEVVFNAPVIGLVIDTSASVPRGTLIYSLVFMRDLAMHLGSKVNVYFFDSRCYYSKTFRGHVSILDVIDAVRNVAPGGGTFLFSTLEQVRKDKNHICIILSDFQLAGSDVVKCSMIMSDPLMPVCLLSPVGNVDESMLSQLDKFPHRVVDISDYQTLIDFVIEYGSRPSFRLNRF